MGFRSDTNYKSSSPSLSRGITCSYDFNFNPEYKHYIVDGEYDARFDGLYKILFLDVYKITEVTIKNISEPAEGYGKKVSEARGTYTLITTKIGDLIGCPPVRKFWFRANYALFDNGWKLENIDFSKPFWEDQGGECTYQSSDISRYIEENDKPDASDDSSSQNKLEALMALRKKICGPQIRRQVCFMPGEFKYGDLNGRMFEKEDPNVTGLPIGVVLGTEPYSVIVTGYGPVRMVYSTPEDRLPKE